MQILKQEVKDKIIEAALNEFYLKGYKNASLRIIAKNSKITVGNIYAYFDNKKALFDEIMEPLLTQLKAIIDDLQAYNGNNVNKLENVVEKIVEMYLKYEKTLMVLLEDSDDMHNYREMILSTIEMAVHDYRKNDGDELIDRAIGISFLSGITYILKTSDRDKLKENIYSYFGQMFVGYGWR